MVYVSNHCSSPGDASGQLTAVPPTCPGDTFTFTCNVAGDINGFTIWRVNGNKNLYLVHRSDSTASNGPFTAGPGDGFGPGTSATSFTSTLSGTATYLLNDTLVECFGPANNVNRGNLVGNATLKILGVLMLTRSNNWYVLYEWHCNLPIEWHTG